MKKKMILVSLALLAIFASSNAGAEQVTLSSGRVIEVSWDTANTIRSMEPKLASAPTMTSEKYGVGPAPQAQGFNSISPQAVVVSEPIKRENHLKKNTAPFEWGKSFNEIGLTAGGYKGDNGLKGGYFIAEANHWTEQKNAGRNWSLLGAFLMYEPGSVDSGYDWSKVKIMYQPGFYDILDEKEMYHLLIKPRIGYSINTGTEDEKNFTYGVYSEFDKIFNPLNRVGFIVDAMLEVRDIGTEGQVAPKLFYEKGIGDEGKKLLFAAGPIWHIAPSETSIGVAGTVSYRVPVSNDFAWKVALTGDVTKDSKTIGAFVSLTWDDIMQVF